VCTLNFFKEKGLFTKEKEGSDQKDPIKKMSNLSEEGEPKRQEIICGNENTAAWKERKTNGSLFEKTLNLQKGKIL